MVAIGRRVSSAGHPFPGAAALRSSATVSPITSWGTLSASDLGGGLARRQPEAVSDAGLPAQQCDARPRR